MLEVRDVAPKKLFMCLSFRVPLAVIERAPGELPKSGPAPTVTAKRKSEEEEEKNVTPVAAEAKKARGEEKEKAKESV